ncbi:MULTISPECIES: flagellar biosynthesis protein FlhB [Rhizobium/Agrobacterium group]|uniref:Flagellar biosynthetic protein FlhB n=2 Tax=Neorhizobium TaxID=1525371 RepID=A0ABV0LWX4_9HYPH|nr:MULTISPECIES: flagellar biosynthesis protein FlhB [Rhizobium/Agrobacterium group]KGD86312.1 flagellar biosynthesis protein FlhB [Rhizobium sp. YS-1r]MCC2608500.1 flagellar biosynthesis protein FlhB [Neorhizobium petrolearium]
MSDEDKDSKTENPTAKRMTEAAEKGNIPFSREVPLFASILAFYVFLVFFLPSGIMRVGETLKDLFEQPDQWRLENTPDVVSLGVHLAWAIAALLVPAMLLFIVFGLASSFAQNMPSLVLERVRPQISRLSPMKGFSRIYSIPGLVEFGKSLFKILIVSIIMYFALRGEFFASLDAMFSDPQVILVKLDTIIRKMVIVVILSAGFLAVVDVLWTRHHWYNQLKMTKQEVKDEYKQAQGDPIVKSRQKSVARDRARRRMINNVPRATLVIANPTHYAVALRYVREENDAPVVVAKGQDLIALKIREIAEANGIPVFEDPPLARSMFAQVSVDSVIPPAFYKAVAELVHRVYASRSLKKRAR